jgi:aldose 1-epimerase
VNCCLRDGEPVAIHHLHARGLHAALRPDLGGSLTGLWWESLPVLRSVEPESLQGSRQSACYALLPYSNRIGDCRFDWLGSSYSTQPNFGDHPHSLHGVGWQRSWEVVTAGESSITMRLRHAPDADWPFAFEALQTLKLEVADAPVALAAEPAAALRRAQSWLHWQIALRNTDSRIQPAGLGWHPYFERRSSSRIQASVGSRWSVDASGLAGTLSAHPPLNALVSDLCLDHCFEAWSGEALVTDERLCVRLQSNASRLVVFTPSPAQHFCVEPVTHANQAIQMSDPAAHGLLALQPGAQASAWMRLDAWPSDILPAAA